MGISNYSFFFFGIYTIFVGWDKLRSRCWTLSTARPQVGLPEMNKEEKT